MTLGEAEPSFDLGDLGAADWNAMRRGAVELDHRAVALLANKSDMGDRDDVAAMDAHEQVWIELSFGFRDRPRRHPLPGAVMHPGQMGIRPDAAHLRDVDEVDAVGALDRNPS